MAEGEKKRANLAKQVTGLSVVVVFLLVVLSAVSTSWAPSWGGDASRSLTCQDPRS